MSSRYRSCLHTVIIVMQKQQGEDGRLEVLYLLKSGTSSQEKSNRLAESIKEMVAIGATVNIDPFRATKR
jgi:hypothetical protein